MFIPCKLQGFCLNIPASWCQEFFQASSWSWLRWYVWDPSKLHKAWDIPRGAKCFESPGTQGFPSPLGKEKKRQHKQQGVFCFPPSPLVRDQKKWTPRKFRMNQQLNHDHVKTFGDFFEGSFPSEFWQVYNRASATTAQLLSKSASTAAWKQLWEGVLDSFFRCCSFDPWNHQKGCIQLMVWVGRWSGIRIGVHSLN